MGKQIVHSNVSGLKRFVQYTCTRVLWNYQKWPILMLTYRIRSPGKRLPSLAAAEPGTIRLMKMPFSRTSPCSRPLNKSLTKWWRTPDGRRRFTTWKRWELRPVMTPCIMVVFKGFHGEDKMWERVCGYTMYSFLRIRTTPHRTGTGPDECFYSVVVVLVGSCPGGEYS